MGSGPAFTRLISRVEYGWLASPPFVLRLYDTAARAKVDFVPRHAGSVSMYVCGPTPYDAPHLGHGRKEVVFDTIRRYLLWCGLEVTYVSNVTDVDDNIIAAPQRDGTTEPELATKYEAEFWRQFDRLNIMRPDEMPRATEWIEPMLALIADLVDSGHAYVIEGEGVYFQVDSLAEYGGLVAPHSRRAARERRRARRGRRAQAQPGRLRAVEGLEARRAELGLAVGHGPPGLAHRVHGDVAADPRRRVRHPRWRQRPRVPASRERARAGARGRATSSRHWLHNGMLNVNGEKMSKSLGNFTTLADVLDRYDPRAFRMLVLKTHYRRQMEVGAKELGDAQKDVESFDPLLRRARTAGSPGRRLATRPEFRAAMDDDFDTPAAVASCRRRGAKRTPRSTTNVSTTPPGA